jgi:serine/threonine protein kinase
MLRGDLDPAMKLAAARAVELEASASAEIDHPVVVAPRDVGVLTDGTPYVVRASREGTSLDDRICLGGPLPAADVVRLALDLLSALAAAHDKNMVHGALTPACVQVVDRESVILGVHLTGFGWDDGPEALECDVSLGFSRLSFVAPELRERGTLANVSSDLYAVAAILYFAATGSSPELARQGASAFGPLPSRIARVLLRAMHPDPTERFECAREMLHGFLLARERASSSMSSPRSMFRSGVFPSVDETTEVAPGPPTMRAAGA